ncbi:MAG: hypothetical protein ABL958_17470 [Bdellovibrionia bacterium]
MKLNQLLITSLIGLTAACGSGGSSGGSQTDGSTANPNSTRRTYAGTYTAILNGASTTDNYQITFLYQDGVTEGDNDLDPVTSTSTDISGDIQNDVLTFRAVGCGGDTFNGTLNLTTGQVLFSGRLCGTNVANGPGTLNRLE